MRHEVRFAPRANRACRFEPHCSMTSAAEIAVGALSASVQRPSFSMRMGTGS